MERKILQPGELVLSGLFLARPNSVARAQQLRNAPPVFAQLLSQSVANVFVHADPLLISSLPQLPLHARRHHHDESVRTFEFGHISFLLVNGPTII